MKAFLLSLLAAGPDGATTTSTAPDLAEEQIVVIGTRTQEGFERSPYATAVLDREDVVGARPTLQLGEALSQVPGVFVTSRENFSQDSRVSIRGFGARSAFGIRGLRVVLDGIPLTLPDGQSQIDSLDMAHIGRIEILRGPAGSLYGNAAGGVLMLESRVPDAPLEAQTRFLVGDFGTAKLNASAGAQLGDEAWVSAFVSRTRTDGWRPLAAAEQTVAQVRAVTRLSDAVRWSAAVHWVDAPVADDPGGLTLEQFRSEPRSAAAVNERFATGEVLSQLQAGSRLEVDWRPEQRTELSAHAGLRDFRNSVPFRTVDFTRDFFGALLVHRWSEASWLSGHRLVLGAEVQGQEDRRGNQGNSGAPADGGIGAPDGELSLLQTERVLGLGLFAQERLALLPQLELLASARYDRIEFDVEDFLGEGAATGGRLFDRLTGQGGVSWQPVERFTLFANVSQAYEAPTTTELVSAAPDGGLSPTLDAQSAVSYELGARTRGRRYRAELTGFFIDLEDELVSAEDAEGRDVFTNAGRSQRVGAEAWFRYRPWSRLELLAAYTWLRATYEDEGREGNLLPGLPEHRLFGRIRYDDGTAFAAAEVEWVDVRFADDANEVAAPAHALVEVRAGARARLGSEWLGILSLGIRNLADVRYVDNVRPNAFGGRALEPGAPLSVFSTLELRYAGGP